MHAEGEDASHLLHASEVRNAWLESAMREAEVEDRTSGVWDLTSDKWEAGDVVQIEGLQSRSDLNEATGILLHWVRNASRWAVAVVATDERIKVRPSNLRRIAKRTSLEDGAQALAAEGATSTNGRHDTRLGGGALTVPPKTLRRSDYDAAAVRALDAGSGLDVDPHAAGDATVQVSDLSSALVGIA